MADLSSDLGRSTRIVVSGYARTRIHDTRLVRGEKRALVITLKGAIPSARTIASARWQCDDGTTVVMSNPRLSDDQKETAIDLLAAWPGCAALKCTMTLDNGEVMAQLAAASVTDAYYFNEGSSPAGPTDLTVTA